MKGRLIAGAGIAFAAVWFAYSAAKTRAQTPPQTPAGSRISVTEVDATTKVLKTNEKRRTVTIKDPMGKRVTINVAPEVSLDQMKKGALVDVRYIDAEAVAISKPGAPPAEAEQTVTLAPQNGASGEVTAVTKRLAGMIKDIDRRKRELTVTGPEERDITLKVAPEIAGFEDAKVGDTAVIDYTEAIAISAARHPENGGESQP